MLPPYKGSGGAAGVRRDRTHTEATDVPYTPEQAAALAAQLGPLYGLRPDQLPTSVFDSVLNGLEQCQAILDAIPQQETPSPLTEYQATVVVEPTAKGWTP